MPGIQPAVFLSSYFFPMCIRSATAEEFRRLMTELRQWCGTQTRTASVHEMLTKLWNKAESDVVAYSHPGCHRTSNPG